MTFRRSKDCSWITPLGLCFCRRALVSRGPNFRKEVSQQSRCPAKTKRESRSIISILRLIFASFTYQCREDEENTQEGRTCRPLIGPPVHKSMCPWGRNLIPECFRWTGWHPEWQDPPSACECVCERVNVTCAMKHFECTQNEKSTT